MATTIADHHVPGPGDERRIRSILLAEVTHGGLPALALILIHARQGDRAAAALPLGALLRAVPQVDWLTCHDLLRQVGLHDDQLLGDLTPAQRRALGEALNHAPRPHQPA
ncbi:hypothetical protein [Streptacidiphilus cavernicola]|uniref:Uncharacterized protein n=1 Tax=Streptacidiphilus cavernicola TaxID=3342716 RepID=A0ABV6VQ14_9ACTN